MPDMTPVADQIQPPDPMRGINTYAGILGIKQRQQAIQGQAAQVQQEQLKAQQAQGVQNFFKSWDPTDHIADDGTTDLDSAMQSPQFKAGGNAKPAIMQSLLDIKNKQLTNKQSLATLNGTLVNQLGTQVGALAKDDDVVADKTDPATGVNPGRAKVDAYFKQFAQLGPDAARVAQIYQPMVDHAPPGKLSHGVAALQMQAEDVGGQQAQQNPVPGSFDTGANILPTVTNRSTGVPQLTGQRVAKQFAPQLANLPNQQLGTVSPGGAVSPVNVMQPPGGGAPPQPPSKLQPIQRPGPNAPVADQQRYQAQVEAATKEYQGVSAIANDPMNGVQATRFRNQQILDLIPHATTGPGTKMLNAVASRLPGSTGDAYQDLEHYTAQNSAALAKVMGVPGTNLGAETAAAAAGNAERNPGALAEITKTNDALNTGVDLYNRGLAKVSSNGSDPSRVAAYKQAFGQNFDVNAMRWADAHRRGDTKEQQAIADKVGSNGMKQINQRLKVMKSLVENGDLP